MDWRRRDCPQFNSCAGLTGPSHGLSYVNVIYIHTRSTMPITARLDEFGKPAWIALIILGFMAWWPLGLCVLAFTIGSGRMGCGRIRRPWPLAGQDGAPARWTGCATGCGGGPWNGAPIQRQPRLRRISHRNAAPPGRGTARIPHFPRPPALCQGQDRVRPVHGRAPRSARRRMRTSRRAEASAHAATNAPPRKGGLCVSARPARR